MGKGSKPHRSKVGRHRGLGHSRAGRPRQAGERYASGRLKPPEPNARVVAGRLALLGEAGADPANLKMAADSTRTDNAPFKAVAFARLPMQLPMLWSAYRAARGS